MRFKFQANFDGVLMIKDGVTTHVPPDPSNADWQIYQLWLADNNVTEPADPL